MRWFCGHQPKIQQRTQCHPCGACGCTGWADRAHPRQLQNKHYDGEDALVKGQNYKYAHDYENHWVEQQYLPDAIKDVKYYTFGDNKTEQAARAYWARIKGEKNI